MGPVTLKFRAVRVFAAAAASIGDRLLGTRRPNAAAAAAAAGLTRAEYLGPYTPLTTYEPHPSDVQHHGGAFGVNFCQICGIPSVITIGARCPHCDTPPTSPVAGVAAGASPGVVSDGLATTAPTPGHTSSVPSIAALIGHHRVVNRVTEPVRKDAGSWGIHDFGCSGTGCYWTGRAVTDHAAHVAELIDAMLAADQRIIRYLNVVRQT